MPGITDVTIITATIPIRQELLKTAVESVQNQDISGVIHLVQNDDTKIGGAGVLDLLLEKVTTKYVCVLDDDDWLLPQHVRVLYDAIEISRADLVYPWFRYASSGNAGHLEQYAYQPWSDNDVHQVPITWIARTDVIKEVGGFSKDYDPDSMDLDSLGNRIGYDFILIKRLVAAGKIIKHHPEITWVYNDNRTSTLGMPSRW